MSFELKWALISAGILLVVAILKRFKPAFWQTDPLGRLILKLLPGVLGGLAGWIFIGTPEGIAAGLGMGATATMTFDSAKGGAKVAKGRKKPTLKELQP
jgi:hypothetical protein